MSHTPIVLPLNDYHGPADGVEAWLDRLIADHQRVFVTNILAAVEAGDLDNMDADDLDALFADAAQRNAEARTALLHRLREALAVEDDA